MAFALIALAADVAGCKLGDCDYFGIVIDAIAIVPAGAALYWADKAEAYKDVLKILQIIVRYEPGLGRSSFFIGLIGYVDNAYHDALLARAAKAGYVGAAISATGVQHILTTGEHGHAETAPCT
jgi:hypothetical protein